MSEIASISSALCVNDKAVLRMALARLVQYLKTENHIKVRGNLAYVQAALSIS
jgi:hypothetical protein